MNVVLSILQVVGWILLAVLIVVVLAVLAILFVPVCYEAEGDIRETSWAKGKLHWLLHLLRAKVSYEDDLLFVEIHILWIRKTFSYEFNKEGEEEELDESRELEETEEKSEDTEDTEDAEEQFADNENASENSSQEVVEEDTDDGMINKTKGIINRIKDILPKLKKIITDKKNQAAVTHLKDELFYLVKILMPKKSKVDAIFSTGSPDTTGQVYGALCCIPIMYRDSWQLLPDFQAEEPYFHGYFWGKGRVYGYKIVGIILRIVFDKNCQRLYTMINKLIKYVKSK